LNHWKPKNGKIGFELSEAKAWKDAEFKPLETKAWKDKGFELSKAKIWRDAGFSPRGAKIWNQLSKAMSFIISFVVALYLTEKLAIEFLLLKSNTMFIFIRIFIFGSTWAIAYYIINRFIIILIRRWKKYLSTKIKVRYPTV